jgi:replication initiation and membrane attachment protein DnaB
MQVQGLRHQNEQLAAMLEQEQITSAKLKEDLVTQITGLLTGFTAKQSQTMKTAVDAIRGKNDLGVESSRQIMARYDAEAEQAARRSTQYREDLSSVKRSAASSREDAQKVSYHQATSILAFLIVASGYRQ